MLRRLQPGYPHRAGDVEVAKPKAIYAGHPRDRIDRLDAGVSFDEGDTERAFAGAASFGPKGPETGPRLVASGFCGIDQGDDNIKVAKPPVMPAAHRGRHPQRLMDAEGFTAQHTSSVRGNRVRSSHPVSLTTTMSPIAAAPLPGMKKLGWNSKTIPGRAASGGVRVGLPGSIA